MYAFVSQRMVFLLVFIQSQTCWRLDSVISFSFNFSLSVQTLKSKLLNWVLNKSWYLDESPNVFSQGHALFGGVFESPKSPNVRRKNFSMAEFLELLCDYSGGGRGAVSCLEDLIVMKTLLYGGHQEMFLQGISQRDCHLFSYSLLFSYYTGYVSIYICIN